MFKPYLDSKLPTKDETSETTVQRPNLKNLSRGLNLSPGSNSLNSVSVKLKENIMFIYQVMLHDPLYDWSVGPSKAAAKQAGEWEKLKKQEDGQGNR